MDPERAATALAEFVKEQGIRTLNVAGPRASKSPGAEDYARAVVRELLSRLAG
jgi:hypothetical protein